MSLKGLKEEATGLTSTNESQNATAKPLTEGAAPSTLIRKLETPAAVSKNHFVSLWPGDQEAAAPGAPSRTTLPQSPSLGGAEMEAHEPSCDIVPCAPGGFL